MINGPRLEPFVDRERIHQESLKQCLSFQCVLLPTKGVPKRMCFYSTKNSFEKHQGLQHGSAMSFNEIFGWHARWKSNIIDCLTCFPTYQYSRSGRGGLHTDPIGVQQARTQTKLRIACVGFPAQEMSCTLRWRMPIGWPGDAVICALSTP